MGSGGLPFAPPHIDLEALKAASLQPVQPSQDIEPDTLHSLGLALLQASGVAVAVDVAPPSSGKRKLISNGGGGKKQRQESVAFEQ